MKCRKSRTRGCPEVKGWDLQCVPSPERMETCDCCQGDTGRGISGEYECRATGFLWSCQNNAIYEALNGDGFLFSSIFYLV